MKKLKYWLALLLSKHLTCYCCLYHSYHIKRHSGTRLVSILMFTLVGTKTAQTITKITVTKHKAIELLRMPPCRYRQKKLNSSWNTPYQTLILIIAELRRIKVKFMQNSFVVHTKTNAKFSESISYLVFPFILFLISNFVLNSN